MTKNERRVQRLRNFINSYGYAKLYAALVLLAIVWTIWLAALWN